MANTVTYSDLALEKFPAIESSEDPTAFNRLLEKKICFSLGSRPATNEKKSFKPYMTIEEKPLSVPSYVVQLLSSLIHLKLHKHGTK